MKQLRLVESTLHQDGQNVKIEEIYSENLYKYSDSVADQFRNEFICVNEAYSNIVQHYLAIKLYVEENGIDTIDITKGSPEFKLYLDDIAQQKGLHLIGSAWWTSVKMKWNFFFVHLASFIYIAYLMAKIPHKGKIDGSASKFAVLRQKSAIQKFKRFDEIAKEYEDLYSKDSVYRFWGRWKRVGWVVKSYLNSFSELREMMTFYRPLLGKRSVTMFYYFYQKRIVYALLYRYMMDDYLCHFEGKTYYTGSNLDRYSVIEEQLAKKHHIDTVCIPHGLEYGYKFPKGFSCDKFYATSQRAADHLNSLYDTNKYVFDKDVVTRMYKLESQPHERMVIFFSENREIPVNKEIINYMKERLNKDGVKLYMKLHPGDSKSNYTDIDIEYITDYAQAMTDNICISRKSTVLLEAIYNNTVPIAIITNPRDNSIFNTFPSLNADKIIKTYKLEDLYAEVTKALKAAAE